MAFKFLDPNIARKSKLLDDNLAERKNSNSAPLFSLIEFNLCGSCNRQCVFCPRSNTKAFPNSGKSLPPALYEKVMRDLQKAKFRGTILYSAFSEPLLYGHLEDVVKLSKKYCPDARIELVSNGDLATKEKIASLFKAGLDTFCISMYDGPQQQEHFKEIQKELGLRNDQMILRVRWLSPKEHFGITLSNRAGMIEIKETGTVSLKEPLKSACYYPFYQTFIDYTGEVLLCPHDWGKKLVLGNINKQSILEIWDSAISKRARIKLSKEDRKFPPCDVCDVTGTLMGRPHFNQWLDYYGKQ